ncbi:unknown [Firmicutes bacterium CAG:791]|nr:unknown [Firmicutes bacterium CAG:791]
MEIPVLQSIFSKKGTAAVVRQTDTGCLLLRGNHGLPPSCAKQLPDIIARNADTLVLREQNQIRIPCHEIHIFKKRRITHEFHQILILLRADQELRFTKRSVKFTSPPLVDRLFSDENFWPFSVVRAVKICVLCEEFRRVVKVFIHNIAGKSVLLHMCIGHNPDLRVFYMDGVITDAIP